MSEFAKIEKKWQKKWSKDHVFEANPDSKKKFFLTVPYPYVNGSLHIGHGRTYTVGDLLARYKRMRGFNVLFPMASHMTGTPVQGMVDRIKAGDKMAIEQYKRDLRLYFKTEEEVDAQLMKFTDAWKTAAFFAKVIHQDFDALGYSIDWRRHFTTGDPIYNEFITWQYHKFMDKGYLKQGNYPLLYCPKDQNPVGEDDLLEGTSAKVKEFTAIKWPFEDGFLVAATLRPETIFGVTNMWIHPDKEYVWAEVDGEKWIVSKPACEKLRLQAKDVKTLESFSGSRIIGKTFRAIHDSHEIPILPAEFVDVNNATGVVYSVPGHAPFDYIALLDLQEDPSGLDKYGISPEAVRGIDIISMIDIKGYSEYPAKDAVEKRGINSQNEDEKLEDATQEIYKAEFYEGVMKDNCAQFSGRPIRDVKEEVIEWMKSINRVDVFYEPDQRPVVCKCGADVQVGVFAGQWFLDYESPGWKDKAWEALNEMDIVPELFRNLFESTFNWLTQRPCARKRGVGTKLPFDEEWIIESLSDSTIYMAFYTIAHHLTKNKIRPKQLIMNFFDYVFLGKGTAKKVVEESGISEELLKIMRDEFKYWYPNDQRHTAPSHISNHLSFAIFHHVAIFPKKDWIQCISLNEHMNMEGGKMSKSKGNTIPLVEIPDKYGADVFRTYVVSAAEPASIMDWRERDVPAVRNRLRQFSDIMRKYSKYTPEVPSKKAKRSEITKWALSRVNSIVRDCTEYLESFRIRDYAITAMHEMIRIVNHYQNRTEVPKEELESTMAYICDKWVRMLAPMIPHLCEEYWSKMGHEDYVSLAEWPRLDKALIDLAAERAHVVVESTISDIREILKLKRDKQHKTVHIYVAPSWMFEAMNSIRDADLPMIVGDIMKHLMSKDEFRKHGKEVKNIVDRIAKENGLWDHSTTAKDEISMLRDSSNYISKELGLKVEVHKAEDAKYDPQSKARFSLPGRVSLYLE
ncbi:MAG: leucine--tRNA ligase [Candidatus Thorarchaeota archaeon]|nr:leucine--tRNA ligase [Candidatus Thorarchaeota archaeon]